MGPTKTDNYASNRYYFDYWQNWEAFKLEGEKLYDEIFSTNKSYFKYFNERTTEKRFEGSTNKSELNKGDFIEYIDKRILDASITSFEELFATIDMGGAFKKSRLKITDNPNGIFDFSLASKGLYELQEYFSQELADELPLEFKNQLPGLVPDDLVDKDIFDNFWYTSKENFKKYQLTQQPKGTRAIELKEPNAKIEYATTTRKSYLLFEKKGGKAKMVDLYVGVGGLENLQFSGMLARALPLMLAARYFELAGIRTRINATRMYDEDRNKICFTWTIKDYGEDLDYNYIALNVADPRIFRWNLWKFTSAIGRGKYGKNLNGYGRTVYGGSELYEIGNRYKNWYFEQMQKGLLPDLGINRNLMIFGGLEKPPSTYDIKTDTDITENIIFEFFRILDIVDFQFNKPELVGKRIYDRLVIEKGNTKDSFVQYVNNVLSQAFSYPQRGEYATEQVEQDNLENQYDVALEGINNFIRSL